MNIGNVHTRVKNMIVFKISKFMVSTDESVSGKENHLYIYVLVVFYIYLIMYIAVVFVEYILSKSRAVHVDLTLCYIISQTEWKSNHKLNTIHKYYPKTIHLTYFDNG